MYPPAVANALEPSKSRVDISRLRLKLWSSVIVRDNIVTVFGFILNRPRTLLPPDLYESLRTLYNAIRLRRIHTIEILPVLKRMSFLPPQEQFVVLFEELYRHVPDHLKSTISVWVEALTEHRVDLNPIIRPGRGPSEVDFLASLEPSELNALEEPMFFRRETAEKASTSLKVLMGPLFSYVFAGLYDGSIQLDQPLFALILLHLPLDEIVPHKDETERFLVDALRLNAILHWDEVMDSVSEADMLEPFRLARAVLQSIANNKKTDQQIRHDSLCILPYIKASASTHPNTNYGIMSEVVGSPSIKFKLLLDHITRLTYSQDLKNLKDRLLDYIRDGYIDLDSAIAGFIRYDYTTPHDVMIALLTRIQRRLPNLSGDMLGTVKALRVHLVFHKVLSQTTRLFPVHLFYFPSLLDAFCDPSLPAKVRQVSRSLSGLLDEEHIDWEALIGDWPAALCTAPRQCFLAVLKQAVLKDVIMGSRTLKLLQKLFDTLNENGDVKDASSANECQRTMSAVEMPITAEPGAQEHATRIPEQMTVTSTAEPSAVPRDINTVVALLPLPHDVLNSTLPNNVSLLDVIPKVPQLQTVLDIIENNTIPELHQLTMYFRNKTRAEALLILLESLLQSFPVEVNSSRVDDIVSYINVLVVEYGLPRIRHPPKLYRLPPPGTDFPAVNPNIYFLPANFEHRESLLPYTTPFTAKDILMKPIREFITRPDLLNILGEDFKPSEYSTKFHLLRAVLEKAITTHVVQQDFYLHDLLTRYLDFLKLQPEETKPSVNWLSVLDALPHAKDDNEYKYFTILRGFIVSPDIEKYIKGFDIRRYSTRGQLLQNCLRYLLTTKQIKEMPELVAAITYFVDKVHLDGFGAKAVEYAVIRQQVVRRTIDLQKAFQAIAIHKLDTAASRALKGVYRFFEKEFQPPIHLANYDLMKHKTKGEWLKAYFTYLSGHPAVSSKARECISAVIPYILLTGPGAESVD